LHFVLIFSHSSRVEYLRRRARMSRRDRSLMEHYDAKFAIAPTSAYRGISQTGSKSGGYTCPHCHRVYEATELKYVKDGYCEDCQTPVRISEITAGKSCTLQATLTHIGESRMVETRYGPRRLVQAVLTDDTGAIELDLWGSQSDGLNVGDQVKLTHAYARSYNEELHVSVGREGRIAKVS
jgi:hypothetical protein